MSSTKLSQDAYDRLKQELETLTTEGRINISKAIEDARALGDLKENGDYHAAKDEQGKIEARIRQLETMLKEAEIVKKTNVGIVDHGSKVTIRYEADPDTETYMFGSIEERHDDLEMLSPSSPLGSALAGHKAGDVVAFDAPNGSLNVTIVEVS